MRIYISKIFQEIIDFIFPPKKEEIILRALSWQSFLQKVKTAEKLEFPYIHSLLSYKDPLVKELIWQIKYRKNKNAVTIASHILYDWLCRNNYKNSTLIPIPISKKRRKERGFNQTELIIDEIIKLDKENYFIKDYKILTREKDLSRQTLKDRKERLEAKDIFKARRIDKSMDNISDNSSDKYLIDEMIDKNRDRNFQNKKIIVIDDVATTGNTAKEARKAILEAGYGKVEVVTLGH